MIYQRSKQKSFTLIELLVVIVIIGILAGVIMISTSSSIDKASFAKAQAFSSTVQNELLSNLVSEWTFDNVSNIGEDTWGNNDAIVYGNPQLAADCIYRECLIFDGDGDYLSVPTSSNLYTGPYLTIMFWMKNNLIGNTGIMGKWDYDGGDYRSWFISADSTYLTFVISDDGTWNNWKNIRTQNSMLSSQSIWTNIVYIFNEGVGKMFVNGQECPVIIPSSAGTVSKIFSSVGNLEFGRAYSLKQFTGYLDDIRIYNNALSSSQIKQNYITGLDSLLSNGNISKEDYNQRINELAYE